MNERSGSENRQRTMQIGLRLTNEEFEELWRKAFAADMSIQDYIRQEVLEETPAKKRDHEGRGPFEICDYCYYERLEYMRHRRSGSDSTYTPRDLSQYQCVCGPRLRCRSPMCAHVKRLPGRKVK